MIGNLQGRHERKIMDIDMLEYIVALQQIDTFCNVSIRQKFVNNTGKLLECSYIFPNDNNFCIYDTEIVLNDRVIRPELRAKEEAEKEYKEAVKQGHSAMLGRDLGDGTCEFKLGNLEDKKEAEIRIKASFLCTSTEQGASLKFPLAAKFQRGEVTSSIPEGAKFELKANIHQNSAAIKNVKCSVSSKTNKIDDKTYDVLINETPDSDAIFIETEFTEGRKSEAIASDGYIYISAYPSFEAKVEINSEFTFLIDCSGSMSGSRIENAAKCMQIFIRSLPEKCKFSIWRFGSNSECMVPSCDYTKENIDKATELIDGLRANLGGTELLEPLVRIMESSPPKGYTRQIFVLTDGEIDNTKDVLGHVRAKRGNNRIFSIGLGSDADMGLINGLAEIANGKGIRVENNNETLTERIIDMLESAIQPALSNVSVICEGMTEQWPSPMPAIYNQSHQSIIIKSQYQEYILISGAVADENIDETIPVRKAPDEIGLKELFMSKAIEDLQYDIRINHDESKKAKIIEYSLASRVLSEYTAYVGIDFESSFNRYSSDDDLIERDYCYELNDMALYDDDENECLPERDFCYDIPERNYEASSDSGDYVGEMMIPQKKALKRMIVDSGDDSADISGVASIPATQPPIDIEKLIKMQNPDGSWDSSTKINDELSKKYNQKIAATIASLAFIRKNAGSALNSLRLIIKKALNFLKKFDSAVDWEAIISNEAAKF
jgi:uncharacterized protein YegL